MRHIEDVFRTAARRRHNLKATGPARLSNTSFNALCSKGEPLFAQFLRSRNRERYISQLMPSDQRCFHADLLSHYLQWISPNWLAAATAVFLRVLCAFLCDICG